MDTVSCDIINDILPLYVDEVVSENSRNMVSKHLERCSACRQQYKELKCEIVNPPGKKEKLLRCINQERRKDKILTSAAFIALTLVAISVEMIVHHYKS